MRRDSTLFYFLNHYGDLEPNRVDAPNGKSQYETDTCMIVIAFLKGLLKATLIVVLICVALYPMAGSIAEGIAQIMHGYNGVGTAQFVFLVVTGFFFSVAAVNYIAVFLGNPQALLVKLLVQKQARFA